jgi:hypothetical protein
MKYIFFQHCVVSQFDLFKLPGEVQEAIKSARVVADRALAACVRAQTRILSTNQVQRFMKKLVIEPISTIKRKATRFVGTSAEVEKAAKKKNKSILLQQTLVEDEEVADAKDPSLEEPNINAPEVRLRCGMHAGWAIECAFGSKFKLDASYVSPHCTLTAKLPALCSDYDVTLLLTESVLHLLSPESAQRCRLVDRIAWYVLFFSSVFFFFFFFFFFFLDQNFHVCLVVQARYHEGPQGVLWWFRNLVAGVEGLCCQVPNRSVTFGP